MNLRDAFAAENPDVDEIRKADFVSWAVGAGFEEKDAHAFLNDTVKRVRRGVYNVFADKDDSDLVVKQKVEKVQNVVQFEPKIVSDDGATPFIPNRIKEFVRWGNFKDIQQIIASGMFFPVFISGMSGNGKTISVEQACAISKREYIRVQINPDTDEDDLIGGFRLENGNTVFSKGPVIKAMEQGAILLIDEIDRGSNRLMCLQGIMEGKPYLIKKTGELIVPKAGFNVFATANTKGVGDETGRYVSATIIDDAFLERFTLTLNQDYPSVSVERKIVLNHMDLFGCRDEEFAGELTAWAGSIRKAYFDSGLDDLVTTRRLCHIVQTFSIFGDKKKALALCLNRFDADTAGAFMDLFINMDKDKVDPNNPFNDDEEAPF